MNKDELRKVKFSKHLDGSGPKDKNGYFHGWATIPYINDGPPFPATRAIVELEDGNVQFMDGFRIQFVEEF